MALAVVVSLAASLASAQVPAGGTLDISTSGYTPSATADAAGNFVAVWTVGDGDGTGIRARRFDAAGNTIGSIFQVNTHTTGSQGNAPGPRVTADAAGGFVVVWDSFGTYGGPSQDGSEAGVVAQRYSPSGEPRGIEFQVNTYTTGMQTAPAVASDAAGNFVVAWWSQPQIFGPIDVVGQRYDSFGARRGSEFRVNSHTDNTPPRPAIASDPAGNVVVVWEKWQGPGRVFSVLAQRYDPSGVPQGPNFEVSRHEEYSQPAVAVRTDGTFVVTWTAPDTDRFGVFARRYDAAGMPVGGEFQVNTTTIGTQANQTIALDDTGGFVVAWDTFNAYLPYTPHVLGQRYDGTGAPRGGEFDVTDPAGRFARLPAMASDPSGNFVVVWEQLYGGIAAQRFGGVAPAPSRVDPQPSSNSDGNGVLEPGESVEVVPFWRNVNGAAQTFGGSALSFTGPAAPSVSYELDDALGAYGTVPNGTTVPCNDCYAVSVPFGGTRPAIHWDATFEERLTPDTLGQSKLWPLHVGESFTDVPKTSDYYRFVETLLHHGVTSGCTAGAYCPAGVTSREQMAVFVLVAKEGTGYVAPACGSTPMFADVPVSSPYCPWIEELARRGVVTGCDVGIFCPTSPVSREQMAVLVLRVLDPSLSPPACVSPNLFADVPQTSAFCPWVEELANRGVVTGCGGGNYCPIASVNREQMSVFLSVTFGLALYGL